MRRHLTSGPFDPQRLTCEATLNRQLVDGREAVELLSAAAVAGLAVDEVGRRLGALIATLRHPETAQRPGTSAWRRAYLEHWQTVTTVWIGGGLATRFGEPMVAEAQAAVDCAVELADDPVNLALVGAANSVRRRDGRAVVFDFGHTSVKRALVSPDGLQVLTEVTVPLDQHTASPGEARAFVEHVIRGTLDGREQPVMASVASYVVDGRPAPNPGLYASLGEELFAAMDDVDVELIHDGTAAARGVPSGPNTAVIVMGSFLAVGFSPQS